MVYGLDKSLETNKTKELRRANVSQVIAEKHRLKILRRLAQGSTTVAIACMDTDIKPKSFYHHLRILLDFELVERRTERSIFSAGRSKYVSYCITELGEFALKKAGYSTEAKEGV